MSTHRIKGEIAFICDDCDDTLETGERDFAKANASRRESGWAAIDGGPDGWVHRCPECKA